MSEAPAFVIEPDGATLERYIASVAPVVGIQGPVGSGKSTASWHKLLVNACLVQPAWKGVRYRRTLVIRNTLKQIRDTVLPTMRQVLEPRMWGDASESGRPKLHIKRWGLDWEILFYGMDDPQDVEDLKSFEASDVYMSEARYLAREIIVGAVERVGRYPPVSWGGGCVRPQVIFDTNPPAMGSWLSVVSGQAPLPEGLSGDERMAWELPKGWEILLQPPAVVEVRDVGGVVTGYVPNGGAENLRYLPGGMAYYASKIPGRTRGEIESELGNKPGQLKVGKAVWPQFRSDVHGATGLEPVVGHPLLVGVDFGRTPAAAIGQHVFGRWRVLREIVTDGMGAREFARVLKGSMSRWFPDHDWACWGDPAGENLEQSDDNSPMLAMRAEGVQVLPAPGNNDWVVRRDVIDELLRRMADGVPAFLVDKGHCATLFAAMSGMYAYPRLQTSDERYGDRPLKNRFSHVADGLQYLVLGGGEGRALFQRTAMGRALVAGRAAAPAQRWRGRGWGGMGATRR